MMTELQNVGFVVDDDDGTLERDMLTPQLVMASQGLSTMNDNDDTDDGWNALVERARIRAREYPGRASEVPERIPSIHQGETWTTVSAQTWVRLLFSDAKESVSWVRMLPAKGKYKVYVGDLAIALNKHNSVEVTYLLLPRLFLDEGEKREKRPAGRPFDEKVVRAVCGEASVERIDQGIGVYRFRGDLFTRQGFLVLSGSSDIAASFQGQLTPAPEEFEAFRHCEQLPWYFRAKTSFKMTQNTIELGDRVKCVDGELRGLIGIVQDISEDSLAVDLPALGITHTAMKWEVRKFFTIGDQVEVSTGQHNGRRGWVVHVNEDEITIMDFGREEEVCAIVIMHGKDGLNTLT